MALSAPNESEECLMLGLAAANQEIFATDTLERISGGPIDRPYRIALAVGPVYVKRETPTDWFRINALFDSGASINCVKAQYAVTHFAKFIKPVKDFKVSTANGTIVIKRYLQLKIQRVRKRALFSI